MGNSDFEDDAIIDIDPALFLKSEEAASEYLRIRLDRDGLEGFSDGAAVVIRARGAVPDGYKALYRRVAASPSDSSGRLNIGPPLATAPLAAAPAA